jgi:nucleotide-binding universal stress UspA family protein
MPFVEIVRAAREGGNELVVIGRHGRRTFPDLLLGSTAERIIRKGRLSVLVVATPPADAYAHPLVAVDLSECSRPALELGGRLAGPSGARLDVVHAFETMSQYAIERAGFSTEDGVEYRLHAQRGAQAAVQAFLAGSEAAAGATVVVREGDARRVVLDVAAERGADLLALGTHGRSGSAHVLLGSVAEAVVHAARCDVVVAVAPVPPFELP